MDFSDILRLLKGGGGDDAMAAPPPVQTADGISSFLGAGTDPGAQDQAAPPAQEPNPFPNPPAQAQAAAPVTPPADAGSGGLSGFLSHMVNRATKADPSTGMSFMDRLGRFGGQITDMTGESRGAAASYQAHGDANLAAAKRAQLQHMADSLGMSPREKLIFTADPGKWVEARAKGLEPATVNGGDTRVNPGEDPYTAPKVGVENGEGYAVTPSGMKDEGGLAMSPAQAAQAAAKEAQEKSLDLYHQIMAAAAAKNADAHMVGATRPRVGAAAGGGGLPPGYVPR